MEHRGALQPVLSRGAAGWRGAGAGGDVQQAGARGVEGLPLDHGPRRQAHRLVGQQRPRQHLLSPGIGRGPGSRHGGELRPAGELHHGRELHPVGELHDTGERRHREELHHGGKRHHAGELHQLARGPQGRRHPLPDGGLGQLGGDGVYPSRPAGWRQPRARGGQHAGSDRWRHGRGG